MIAIIIVCILIVLAIVYSIMTYKKLVTLRRNVANTWKTLNTSLDERFQILTKYIILLQQVATERKDVLQKAVDSIYYANASKNKADKIAADTVLRNVINELFSMYNEFDADKYDNERVYPSLYIITERISAFRQAYNLAVKAYNDKVLKYPSKIIAFIGRFKPEIYYEASVTSKKEEVESLL